MVNGGCVVCLDVYFFNFVGTKKIEPFTGATRCNITAIMHFRIVSIEGNIGSGKSTLLKELHKQYQPEGDLKVVMLDEPVDEWATIQDEDGVPMLSKFYQHPTKYAFAFQMMAFISRLVILKRAIASAEAEGLSSVMYLFVTERSVLTDRYVFAQMLLESKCMESIEHQIYVKWFDEFVTQNMSLHVAFYLPVEPHVCLERVQKRNRSGEETITLQYLTECHQFHEAFIQQLQAMKVQVVKCTDVSTIVNTLKSLQ